MLKRQFMRVAVACTSLIASAAIASPMNFRLIQGAPGCDGCVLVGAEGEITADTPAVFDQFVQKNHLTFNKSVTVTLNSPGGSLVGGLKLGDIFRKSGFATHIARLDVQPDGKPALSPGECASACAYAYLGGYRRSIDLRSKYGVHQISVNSTEKVSLGYAVGSVQDLIGHLTRYVERMGVSQEIVTRATKTRSNSINWIGPEDLSALRIINSSGPNTQAPWKTYSGLKNWSVDSFMPDGSRYSLIMYCTDNGIPTRFPLKGDGLVTIIIIHYKVLLKENIFHDQSSNSTFNLESNSVNVFSKPDRIDFANHISIGVEVPFSILRNAVGSTNMAAVRLSLPEEVVTEIGQKPYPFPKQGFNKAIETIARKCPRVLSPMK